MAKDRKTELDVDPKLQDTQLGEKLEASPETEPEAKAPEVKKRSKLKLYIIVGLIATVLALGVLTAFLLLKDGEKPQVELEKSGEEKLPEEEKLLELELSMPPQKVKKLNNLLLEPFTISISEPGGKRFMRVTFSLQLSNGDAVSEVEENLVIMREAVYLFIRNRKASDFMVPENRVKTLSTLKRLLDRSIQNGRVEEVLITELSVY